MAGGCGAHRSEASGDFDDAAGLQRNSGRAVKVSGPAHARPSSCLAPYPDSLTSPWPHSLVPSQVLGPNPFILLQVLGPIPLFPRKSLAPFPYSLKESVCSLPLNAQLVRHSFITACQPSPCGVRAMPFLGSGHPMPSKPLHTNSQCPPSPSTPTPNALQAPPHQHPMPSKPLHTKKPAFAAAARVFWQAAVGRSPGPSALHALTCYFLCGAPGAPYVAVRVQCCLTRAGALQ